MKWLNLAGLLALILLSPALLQDGRAALPTAEDVSWTPTGGIRVNDWLVIEEDYGRGKPGVNVLVRQKAASIEYRNDLVNIVKEWRLEGSTLIVKQRISPLSEAGRHSDLILRLKMLRAFDGFFTPYAFTAPRISGRWIEAGQLPALEVPRGAYSNAMLYTLLHGEQGSIMLDRVLSDDYLAWEGGISGGSGDFSELVWPMLAFGHWSWNLGHPGPTGKQQAWMENVYPDEGGSLEYRIHFFPPISRQRLGAVAYGLYLKTRKAVAQERQMYQGWRNYHRAPADKIAFYAFVGYSWSSVEPWGIPGLGGNRKKGLIVSTPVYLKNLTRMRAILDENGLQDAYIFFWIQGYDGRNAGWGQFPLDVQPVKDFFAQVRDAVHHVRLGVYVNFWICPTEAPVYQEHPEWFSKEFHWSDAGSESYAGKLPEWGDYLASQMPALIHAYNLDFIFFDGADWTSRWKGTHQQCRDFFGKISQVVHDNGAEFWANGNVPFVDVGMDEQVAGESVASDADLAANFSNISFHECMMGPMFSWRSWRPVLFFRSGRSILDHFADKPEFLIRWPIHYYGEDMDYILEHFFTPYIKKRAVWLNQPAPGSSGS